MSACGVPWPADDYILYSPAHDRPLPAAMYKIATQFRSRVTRLSAATTPRRLAAYYLSAYLLVDCRPSELQNLLS
eukprot:6177038-Pleurochrysis_carterae.AAC.1